MSDSPTSLDNSKKNIESIEGPGPRERVLKAALELFVDQGYFNTNVPDISKRSKCSVGSIYHHFLNKEEIAGQLYLQCMKEFRDALCEAIDLLENAETNIRNIVICFLEFAEKHRLIAQYLWLARHTEYLNSQIQQPTVVGFDEFGRRITKVIKRGIRLGEIPALDAEIFWIIVFGMPLSYMRDWLDGFTERSPREVAPMIADACWAGLTGVAKKSK